MRLGRKNMNLNLMKKIAKMSPHVKYQHCSLIFAGNRLLAYGYNLPHVHSEIVALRRLSAVVRNQDRMPKNLHMINIMLKKKSGSIGNSRPCIYCMTALYTHEIKKVTFTNSLGDFIQEKVL